VALIYAQDLENKMIKHIGMDGSRQMLPPMCACILEWGGPEILEAFEKKIPPTMRFSLEQ
jgi:hypothetical protein